MSKWTSPPPRLQHLNLVHHESKLSHSEHTRWAIFIETFLMDCVSIYKITSSQWYNLCTVSDAFTNCTVSSVCLESVHNMHVKACLQYSVTLYKHLLNGNNVLCCVGRIEATATNLSNQPAQEGILTTFKICPMSPCRAWIDLLTDRNTLNSRFVVTNKVTVVV